MSASGRPAGRDEATIENARRILLLHDYDVPVDTIMEREKISQAMVYKLIAIGRTDRASNDPPKADAPADDPDLTARPPRKLSEGTVLRRLLAARHSTQVIRSFDPGLREFWNDVVLEIRAHGHGGVELPFAEPGLYHSAEDLAGQYGRPVADLQTFFKRELLVETAAGIAMPYRFDLRPKAKAASDRAAPKRDGGKITDHRQTTMLHSIRGGRADSTEIQGVSVESDSTETPADGRVSVESAELVHAAAAAAKDLERLDSQASSSSSTGARDSTETPADGRISVESNPGISVESTPPAAPADLAAELAEIAGMGRPPNTKDRAVVLGFQAGGIATDLIRATIAAKVAANRTDDANWRPRSLKYFAGAIRDAATVGAPAAAAVPHAASPASPPVSHEDRCILALLAPCTDAFRKDASNAPWPPTLDSYKAALADPETAILAGQWLSDFAAWNDAGRPVRLKPPDFRKLQHDRRGFADRLADIEEELTAPDVPAEDSG